MIFEVFEKTVRHRIYKLYFWYWSRNQDFIILEISVSAVSPCMANMSVSTPKMPYQSISIHVNMKNQFNRRCISQFLSQYQDAKGRSCPGMISFRHALWQQTTNG